MSFLFLVQLHSIVGTLLEVYEENGFVFLRKQRTNNSPKISMRLVSRDREGAVSRSRKSENWNDTIIISRAVAYNKYFLNVFNSATEQKFNPNEARRSQRAITNIIFFSAVMTNDGVVVR